MHIILFIRSNCSLLILLLFCILFSLIPSISFSLPTADKHFKLWISMLGIDEASLNSTYIEKLNRFSTLIDGVSNNSIVDISCFGYKTVAIDSLCSDNLNRAISVALPDISSKISPSFSPGFCSGTVHRQLFHWGYNVVDPTYASNSKPFRERLQKSLSNETALAIEEKRSVELFLYCVIKEIFIQRNREMHRISGDVFGLTRNFITPISTLLYEIHILADYCDTLYNDLGEIEYHVERELIRNGIKPLFQGLSEAQDLILKIEKILRSEQNNSELIASFNQSPTTFKNLLNIPNDSDPKKALAILLLLQENLPKLILKMHGQTLSHQGIKISPTEESKTKGSLIDKFLRKR
jgi:hypothetical protein